MRIDKRALRKIEQLPEIAAEEITEPDKDVEAERVESVKHPLEHTWGLWLYRETSKNWGKGLVELTSFSTVEDFWCLYHHIKLPSELGQGQYSVFKGGLRPEWEHPANKRGGRWLVTLEKRHLHHMDRIWTDMVLLMIGENFEEVNSEICGAVVNAKAKNNSSKLAIWVSNKRHEIAIKKIGMKLRQELNLPFKINFHAHGSNVVKFSL